MPSKIIERADEVYTDYMRRTGQYHAEQQFQVNRVMARAVISAVLEEMVAAHQDAYRRLETKT